MDRDRRPVVGVLRLLLAAVGVAGVLGSVLAQLGDPGYSPANRFSCFTVQSNLLLAAVLAVDAAAPPRARRWDALRAASVPFMLVTGIVFAVLLADVAVGQSGTWTNAVVHQLMPVVALLDLLLVPPRRRIAWRTGLLWLLSPLAHCGCTLLSGPVVDWCPYPFLDPTDPGGYPAVARSAVVPAVFTAAPARIVVALARASHRWLGARASVVAGPGTRHHPE